MRCFYLEGLCQSQKIVFSSFMTNEDPRGRHISLQFIPFACYMIAQQCPCLVRLSLRNTGEQRERGGLTNITISSQVACDHRKVLRAELVSTPQDLVKSERGRR